MSEELSAENRYAALAVKANQAIEKHKALEAQTDRAYWNAVSAKGSLNTAVHEETGLTGPALIKRVNEILHETNCHECKASNEG